MERWHCGGGLGACEVQWRTMILSRMSLLPKKWMQWRPAVLELSICGGVRFRDKQNSRADRCVTTPHSKVYLFRGKVSRLGSPLLSYLLLFFSVAIIVGSLCFSGVPRNFAKLSLCHMKAFLKLRKPWYSAYGASEQRDKRPIDLVALHKASNRMCCNLFHRLRLQFLAVIRNCSFDILACSLIATQFGKRLIQ